MRAILAAKLCAVAMPLGTSVTLADQTPERGRRSAETSGLCMLATIKSAAGELHERPQP